MNAILDMPPVEYERITDLRPSTPREKQPLETLSADSFAGQDKPERLFVVENLVPLRHVTLLYGDGGTGKSLLALQLSASVSHQTLRWLEMSSRKGNVLYLSAEDDCDECHIRLADICEVENIALADLGNLHIAFMAGQDCLLAVENGKGGMDKTPLFQRLEAKINLLRPTLVVLDNLADIFGGNENAKGLVRQFIGMLRALAITYDCAIVVLAHPSLSGMATGTGTSGNVAWNNSVRSRLYLKRQNDDPKEVTDHEYRKLVTMKSNSGPIGGEVGMRWEQGRFRATQTPAAAMGVMDRMAVASKAERVFLQLVAQFNAEGRTISTAQSAAYAPVVFAKHHGAEGMTKRQFEVAMNRLLSERRIKIVQTGPASKRRQNIEVCGVNNDE